MFSLTAKSSLETQVELVILWTGLESCKGGLVAVENFRKLFSKKL